MLTQLIELTGEQDDVVSRAQLRKMGISRHRVRTEVRAGRWTLVGPRVIVLHSGQRSRQQWWWVAVLHAGPQAALHGYTAAEAAGLRGWERRPVHVLVPKGVRVPPLPGLVVHESRRLTAADLDPTGRPPRTRLPRAVVDAAAAENTARLACALLASVVHQRLATAAELRTELAAAGPVRQRRMLQAVLDDMAGGGAALTGIDFVRLCRTARMPLPDRQRVRPDASGRIRFLDATWRRRDGRAVQAEVDGAVQLISRGRWDDLTAQAEARISGNTIVLRFPSAMVRLEPETVTTQIARALGIAARPRPPAALPSHPERLR